MGDRRSPVRPWSVVIVDDSDDLRFATRHLLDGSGPFRVVGEAANGRDAIEVVATAQPDLVLLDLQMPVMDGPTALPLIRQAAGDATRVVIWSALIPDHTGTMVADLIGSGATGVLAKGDAEALVRELVAVMEHDPGE